MLCQATLRIGAAQLLYLDTPSYAVLKETVEVLKMHPKIKVA
jgi:transcription termination factor NusB